MADRQSEQGNSAMNQICPEEISARETSRPRVMRLFCSTSVRARQFNSPSSSTRTLASKSGSIWGQLTESKNSLEGQEGLSVPLRSGRGSAHKTCVFNGK